jgi:hypothetical protein
MLTDSALRVLSPDTLTRSNLRRKRARSDGILAKYTIPDIKEQALFRPDGILARCSTRAQAGVCSKQ